MEERRQRDHKADGSGQRRQSIPKALEAETRGRQAVGTRPWARAKVTRLGCRSGIAPPRRWGPPVPGASTAPGSSALIRGPANGSEDWPVPGTLLNRDLGEIYS